MIWNFLVISASDVDVEHLFNSVRNVCHYCWNQLLSETIHAIMIQMCTDCFNLKQEYVWIFDDIIIEEKNWNMLANADKDFDDSMYINENELKNKTHSIHKNNILNSHSIVFWQHSTISQTSIFYAKHKHCDTFLISEHYHCWSRWWNFEEWCLCCDMSLK